jgi:tetratricopeptide (TPR) repeat protein
MKNLRARLAARLLKAEAAVPWIVALATFLAFSGSLRNGFLNWDDPINFLQNPHFRGFGWANLRWMFTFSSRENYEPLSWLVYAATYVFWGLDPYGYHLAGILLHVLVATALYAATVRLLTLASPPQERGSGAVLRWSAGIAALLYALHPLRVEAVAWISAQHHLLASFFFLVAVWSYLGALEAAQPRSRRRRLGTSLISYALSLLAFPIGVTLPIALLLLDGYLHRCRRDMASRLDFRSSLIRSLPFFFLAACGALAAIRARAGARFLIPIAQLGVKERVLEALFGVVLYLWKTFLPFGLSPYYPIPAKIVSGSFLLGVAFMALLTVAALAARRKRPAAIAVWAYFITALLPVLGSTPGGSEIITDRYTYLSSFGFAALTAGVLARIWTQKGPRVRQAAGAVVGALLVTLACLTSRQLQFWHDSVSLWTRAAAVSPHVAFIHNNLGSALYESGSVTEAIPEFERAIAEQPNFAVSHYNLGVSLAGQGKTEEAIRQYEAVLQTHPDFAPAHHDLGLALVKQGKISEAIRRYDLALRLQPDFPEAQTDLALALVKQGKTDEAIGHLRRALELKPDFKPAQESLSKLLDRPKRASGPKT